MGRAQGNAKEARDRRRRARNGRRERARRATRAAQRRRDGEARRRATKACSRFRNRSRRRSVPRGLRTTKPFDETSLSWADAVVIGPGLGLGPESEELLDRVLAAWKGPTLLDADAITLSRQAPRRSPRALRRATHARHAARRSSSLVSPASSRLTVLARRFEIGGELAKRTGATVLLKGVPTVVTNPDGDRLVSAAGTPVLATGGSGDVLSGIAGTLLAQIGDPFLAGAAAAWVHGRAAERATATATAPFAASHSTTSSASCASAWTFDTRPTRYPVLAELSLSRWTGGPVDRWTGTPAHDRSGPGRRVRRNSLDPSPTRPAREGHRRRRSGTRRAARRLARRQRRQRRRGKALRTRLAHAARDRLPRGRRRAQRSRRDGRSPARRPRRDGRSRTRGAPSSIRSPTASATRCPARTPTYSAAT